jgi:hypothetical protein
MLRQFLYLDERLQAEFLSQAEGGTYDAQQEKRTSAANRKGSAGVRIPVLEAGAELTSGSDESVERKVTQTPSSQFDRLYNYLTTEELVTALGSADQTIWDAMRRGTFVEIEATVALSGMSTIAKLAEAAQGFIALSEAIGQPVDDETKAQFSVIELVTGARASETLPVIVRLAGTPEYKFRADLDREHIRVDEDDLIGESVVIGKVQRKLERGQTLPLDVLFPGIEFVSNAERKKLEKTLRATNVPGMPIGEMSLSYPAAVLTPLAIFR